MRPLEKEKILKSLDLLEELVERLRTGDGLESEFERYKNLYEWIYSARDWTTKKYLEDIQNA